MPVVEKPDKDGASVVIIPQLVDQAPPPYQPCVEDIDEAKEDEEEKDDPWDLPALQDNSPCWHG